MKKIVISPDHLRALEGRLAGAAAGLRSARASVPTDLPSMRSGPRVEVDGALQAARTALRAVDGELIAMAQQLKRRRNFSPPEHFPTFEPTLKLQKAAAITAGRHVARIRKGKDDLPDDLQVLADPELMLQILAALDDQEQAKYLSRLDERLRLARELVEQREWQGTALKHQSDVIKRRNQAWGKYHVGWVYPAKFLTGFSRAETGAVQGLATALGGVRELFDDDRRRRWRQLGLPTDQEVMWDSVLYTLTNPEEILKAAVAWETLQKGKYGEASGEIFFNVAAMLATRGGDKALSRLDKASSARRLEASFAGTLRSARRRADALDETAAAMRARAEQSRRPAPEPGGGGRNVAFQETRRHRRLAEETEARAERARVAAASTATRRARIDAIRERHEMLAGVGALTSYLGFDVSGLPSRGQGLAQAVQFVTIGPGGAHGQVPVSSPAHPVPQSPADRDEWPPEDR